MKLHSLMQSAAEAMAIAMRLSGPVLLRSPAPYIVDQEKTKMPDTAEYLARISQHTQGKDPLELQRQAPEILAALIAQASHEQLTTRPSKDKWSVGEILAH